MTRGDFLFKWFWYAMAVLPFWLLEEVLFSRFPLFALTPMLLPLTVAAAAVLEGSVAGAGFGLGVGLLCAAAPGQAGAGMVPLLALAGALTGAVGQYGLKQNYPSCLLCSAAILAAIDLFRLLPRLAAGVSLAPMLAVALSEIVLSLLFTPFVYLLFRRVYSRVGGTRLM